MLYTIFLICTCWIVLLYRHNITTNKSQLFAEEINIVKLLNMEKRTDIHTLPEPFRGNRGNCTWKDNYDLVTKSGHQWCQLVRDNWSCCGDRYRQLLLNTSRFDNAYSFDSLPSGSRIFIEGNSFMAQHILLNLCNTKDFTIYQIKNRDGANTPFQMGSIVALNEKKNVSIVTFCNNNKLNWNFTKTIEALSTFRPTLICLGNLNLSWEKEYTANISKQYFSIEQRLKRYRDTYKTRVVVWSRADQPAGCEANFKNCHNNLLSNLVGQSLKGEHQCFHSLVPSAEKFGKILNMNL